MRILRGWINFLKGQPVAPEHSIALRVSVGVVVMLAIVATAHQLEWPQYALAALVLTPLGMIFSYLLRARNNWEVKAILSILMVITMLRFFAALTTSVFDPRVPLAELLLWLQTLHSWDLPRRKDLNYSLMVGLILMSLASVLSVDMSMGLYLAGFSLAGLVAMHLNYRSALGDLAGERVRPARRGVVLRTAFTLVLVSAAIFLMLPRYQSMRLRSLPFSWQMRLQLPKVSQGQLVNPDYPQAASKEEFKKKARFSADSYFGFNSLVALNMRGQLSDEIVMKVRSSRWNYYRGLTFDQYDGQFWTLSDDQLRSVRAAYPPLYLPTEVRGHLENVQIYYIEKTQPNLIFSTPEASQLFFPSEEIFMDSGRGLRSPYPLEEGTVYSVISFEPNVTPEQIRRLPNRDGTVRRLKKYLALPETSPRMKALAKELTEGVHQDYQKAMAICLYLKRTFEYRSDIPPFPENAETADYFLFEQKRGYCEQFATAMAVLCRLSRVHARYVTGYLPGAYNPLTGFHEVRGKDAHAWVEVFVPNLGWVAFDPTPDGLTTPGLESPSEDRWLLASVIKYLGRKLGLESPDLKGMAAELHKRLGFSPWLLLLPALACVAWLLRGVRLAPAARTPRERVQRNYRRMLDLMPESRTPGETPAQFAQRVQRPEVDRLTRLFEKARYSQLEVEERDVAESQTALDELRRSRPSRKVVDGR